MTPSLVQRADGVTHLEAPALIPLESIAGPR